MRIAYHLVAASLCSAVVSALGEKRVISFPSTKHLVEHDQTVLQAPSSTDVAADLFLIADHHSRHATPLLLSSKENVAVHIAARSFAHDVYRVTGVEPKIYNDTVPHHVKKAIVVGTVESDLIKQLSSKDQVDPLEGKWESYDVRVTKNPLHGLQEGLVVVGSNRVSLEIPPKQAR